MASTVDVITYTTKYFMKKSMISYQESCRTCCHFNNYREETSWQYLDNSNVSAFSLFSINSVSFCFKLCSSKSLSSAILLRFSLYDWIFFSISWTASSKRFCNFYNDKNYKHIYIMQTQQNLNLICRSGGHTSI